MKEFVADYAVYIDGEKKGSKKFEGSFFEPNAAKSAVEKIIQEENPGKKIKVVLISLTEENIL